MSVKEIKKVNFNRKRVKEKLWAQFVDSGLQEQSDGKREVLIFTEGIQHMSRDYEEEAFLLTKVVNICKEEIFKNKFKFPSVPF